MKIIFFSLALICATSLISNPADDVRRVIESRSGCSICPIKCEICGKEIHDDEEEADDATIAEEQEENPEVKCGCGGGIKPPRPPR